MKKLLATDLDGTLFYPKRPRTLIAKKNLKLVRSFLDDGGKLLLVTGRSPHFSKIVQAKIGRPLDVIGMNGAYVMHQGQVISEKFLDFPVQEVLEAVQSKFKILGMMLLSHTYPLLIYVPPISGYMEFIYRLYYRSMGVYGENFLMSNDLFIQELQSKTVYKVMIFFGMSPRGVKKAMNANKFLRENYSEYLEASWTGGFVEITPKGCSKARGINDYIMSQGIGKNELAVVGDSGNDISMFQEFYDNSFCLKHANKKVKKYAKTIIGRFHHLKPYLYEEIL